MNDKMNYPLISIVICTYNGERFIEEQLQSILDQTYPNIEIIISDDASTDRTPQVLKKYETNPVVKLILNKKNIGFAKNFEQTAKMASGDFIAFSDQDDIFLPEKMERLLSAIGDHSLVYSDSKLIDEDGNYLGKKLSDVRALKSTNDSRNFFFINAVSGHTMMIKKDVLQTAFPIPAGYYHDWWMAIHAANKNGIIYLDEPLSFYRQHKQSVTKTIGNKNVPSRKRLKRYNDFMYELTWLDMIKNNPDEKHKAFAQEVYDFFLLKRNGSFSWPLFFFLIKHKKTLFTFWKKSTLSQIVELRKMARGEQES